MRDRRPAGSFRHGAGTGQGCDHQFRAGHLDADRKGTRGSKHSGAAAAQKSWAHSEGKEERAYDITKKLLLERPDLNGIVGLNEPSTVGAGRAIRELGLAGKVKLVGFDSSVKEVKALEEGFFNPPLFRSPSTSAIWASKQPYPSSKETRCYATCTPIPLSSTKTICIPRRTRSRSFPLWKSSFFFGGLLTEHRLFNTDQRIFHSSIGDRFVQ